MSKYKNVVTLAPILDKVLKIPLSKWVVGFNMSHVSEASCQISKNQGLKVIKKSEDSYEIVLDLITTRFYTVLRPGYKGDNKVAVMINDYRDRFEKLFAGLSEFTDNDDRV